MIEKRIEIDGQQVPFRASAAIPRLYRSKFGRDIFRDLMKLGKAVNTADSGKLPISDLEMFENVAYIMAKHADPGHQRSGWTSLTRSRFTRCCRNCWSSGT